MDGFKDFQSRGMKKPRIMLMLQRESFRNEFNDIREFVESLAEKNNIF